MLIPFRIPMRRRFRGVDHRSGVLVRGVAGWGEFSPFPEYGPEYAARWLRAARAHAGRAYPEPVRDRVPVNATVPATVADEAFDLVAGAGCTTVKVKVGAVGQDLDDDLDRVAAVRDALGPDGHVRVDANGAWDVDTAARALSRLDRYDLQYAEQPVATLEEMRALRRRVDVPLAADESLRTARDPLRIAGLDAADLIVVKVQPLGGVWRALSVIEAAGLPAVVSSALETSVGLAAGVALAAALPELPYACGLGTATLLAGDLTRDPLVPEDGAVPVRRPDPEPDLLARWRAPEDEATDLLASVEAAGAADGPFL